MSKRMIGLYPSLLPPIVFLLPPVFACSMARSAFITNHNQIQTCRENGGGQFVYAEQCVGSWLGRKQERVT